MCGPQSPLTTDSRRPPFVKVGKVEKKEVPRHCLRDLYSDDDTIGTSTIAVMKYVEDLHRPGQVRELCIDFDGLE